MGNIIIKEFFVLIFKILNNLTQIS